MHETRIYSGGNRAHGEEFISGKNMGNYHDKRIVWIPEV